MPRPRKPRPPIAFAAEVDAFLAYLEHEKRAPPKTREAYGADLVHLGTFALARGVTDVAGLTVPVLRAWAASITGAASTRQRRIACVRSWQRWMLRRGMIATCPAERLAMPKVARTIPRVLSTKDAARLVERPDTRTAMGMRDRAILELLYGSGLRASELVGLDLDALDLDAGVARVIGKGDRERVVPLGRACVSALRRWLRTRRTLLGDRPEAKDERAVFVAIQLVHTHTGSRHAAVRGSRGSFRLRLRGLQMVVTAYCRRAALDGAHTHTLRHSCATAMLDGGADVRVVQELLGHRKITTTQTYLHTSTEQLVRVYKRALPRGLHR